MPKRIDVGDEIVEFPDDMSDADIEAALAEAYPAKAEPAAPPPSRKDQGLGFETGAKRVAGNALEFLHKLPGYNAYLESIEGLPNLRGGKIGDVSAHRENLQKGLETARAEGREPGIIGDIAGSTVAGLPLALATRNPWLLGGASGALNTSDPNNPGQVASDVGWGGIAGKLGDSATKALGAVVAPRLDPMVKKLLGEGIELTPGQMLGGVTKRVEDAMTSTYGVGDMILGAKANAEASVRRKAVQSTLEPIGVELPKNLKNASGHQQVAFAQKTLSDAYTSVLDDIDVAARQTGSKLPTVPGGAAAGSGLRLDPQFAQEISSLRTLARGLPRDQQRVFETFVMNDLQMSVNPKTGSLSGQAMKELDEKLGKEVADYRTGDPDHRKLAAAFQELQYSLREMVGRQFPQHKAALDGINEGYAKLIRVEDAAKNAKSGNFGADALRSAAVRRSSRKTAARGEGVMQEFANRASEVVMPSTRGNLMSQVIANSIQGAALFGGGAAGFKPNPWALAMLGALGAPYANRTTQGAARTAIARRPAAAPAARRAIEKAGPVAAIAAGSQRKK